MAQSAASAPALSTLSSSSSSSPSPPVDAYTLALPSSLSVAPLSFASVFLSAHVKAWGAHSVLLVVRAGETARWEYQTDKYCIQFGVGFTPDVAAVTTTTVAVAGAGAVAASKVKEKEKSKDKDKKKEKDVESDKATEQVIVASARIVGADERLQHGRYTAPCSGTIRLTFDNSYSKLRGKTVRYHTSVVASSSPGSSPGSCSSLAASSSSSVSSVILLGDTYLTAFGPATVHGCRLATDGIYVVALAYGLGYLHRSALQHAPVVEPRKSTNERCMVGVALFFNNRVWESEDFFLSDVDQPMFSLAYGSLGFLRALMTWDKSDIIIANDRLRQCRHLVTSLLPPVSTLRSVGRFLTRSTGPTLSAAQVELTLLQAEAFLLQAMLLLTEEAYMSYLKAGLKIRSAWGLYTRCEAAVAGLDAAARNKLDASVVGGIQFGIGCFNVILSILPAMVLRVVSALGFPSDRAWGMALLEATAAVPGVRQPLAQLLLLFVHIVIPTFFTVRLQHHTDAGRKVLDACFAQYPAGALFLWMEGRNHRMHRSLAAARTSFTRSAAGQPQWLQLQHLCAYELGWCNYFATDYERSDECWARLERESEWSKAFFVYMRCVGALGSEHGLVQGEAEDAVEYTARLDARRRSECVPLLRTIEAHVAAGRKFGNKTLSVEQFIARRGAQLLKEYQRTEAATAVASSASTSSSLNMPSPYIAVIEVVYLFSGLPSQSDALLHRSLSQLDAVIANGASSYEDVSLGRFFRCVILKLLHRYAEAKAGLIHLSDRAPPKANNSVPTYFLPMVRFELAALGMEQIMEKDAEVEEAEAASRAGIARTPKSCSVDEPDVVLSAEGNIVDAVAAKTSASSSSTVAATPSSPASASSSSPSPSPSPWSSRRLVLLSSILSALRCVELMKFDFDFKSRLHLRLHLAVGEVDMMKRNWKEKETTKAVGAVAKGGNQQTWAEKEEGETERGQEEKE